MPTTSPGHSVADARCDVEVYGGGPSILLPRALRINGETVYTPPGAEYELVGGSNDAPLVLRLNIMPTLLKFLPGQPPTKEVPGDGAAR